MEIGKILKKNRLKKKLTLIEMGNILGYSKTHLAYVEKTNKASKKMAEKILEKLELTQNEEETIRKVYMIPIKKMIVKTELFTEKEVLDTHDFIRKQNMSLSMVADINRDLIDLNTFFETKIIRIEKNLDFSDEELKLKVTRALKTTIKRLKRNVEDLEEMLYTNEVIKLY